MAQTPSTKLQNALVVRENHEMSKRRKQQIAVGIVAGAAILGAVGFALATRSNRETVSRYASKLGGYLPGREEPTHVVRARLSDLSDNIRELLRR